MDPSEPDETHYRKLENMYHQAPINGTIPCRIQIAEGRSEVTLTAGEEFWHAAKALHGSLYFKGLDDAAYFAANSMERENLILTARFEIELLGMVQSGPTRSVGYFERREGKKIWARAEQYDKDGALVARGKGLFIVGKFALDASVQYTLPPTG